MVQKKILYRIPYHPQMITDAVKAMGVLLNYHLSTLHQINALG